jgi:hypothetical protein
MSTINATTNQKPVAVIILNWNGAKLLRKFLPSVVANTSKEIADVIVADNGSTDDSLDLLRSEFTEVAVLPFPENLGFAGGYNRALRETGYQYTVLLNSDVETPAGWLEPLYDFMEKHSHAAACQPKILSYTDKSKFEYAGAAGGYIDRNGYPYCRGRLFDTVEVDNGQYDNATEVFWATGAALMVRTELYNRVGGLDERFFAHMEEIDLCWRLLLMGESLWCVPASKVYHLGGGSLPVDNPRKTYLNFRNNLLLLHKNLPVEDLGPALFRRRLLDTVAWAKFLLTGDRKNADAILQAHRDFKSMRKHYTQHPTYNLLKMKTAKPRPNILVEYFLKKRRYYYEL